MYISSYMNIYTVIKKHARACQQQDGFILHDSFFSTSEYIKYIKSGRKFQLCISNDIWPHVFISEVRSYIFMFLVAYLGYIFFSYMSIVHLLWRREGIGIYCKLIHVLIELTRARIFFSWPIQNRNTEPNSKYYLDNYL